MCLARSSTAHGCSASHHVRSIASVTWVVLWVHVLIGKSIPLVNQDASLIKTQQNKFVSANALPCRTVQRADKDNLLHQAFLPREETIGTP